MYQPLLSMVTFIPAFAAFVLLMVARGEDLAAQLVCKRVAMFTTVATFLCHCLFLLNLSLKTLIFKWLRAIGGFWD